MTKKAPKLSPARHELLKLLSGGKLHSGVPWYPPIKWALKIGLIESVKQRFSEHYRITQRGTEYYEAVRTTSDQPNE